MIDDNSDAKTLIIENTYYSLLLYILSDEKWKDRDYFIIDERISGQFISRFKMMVGKVTVLEYFPRIRVKRLISSIIKRLRFIKEVKKYSRIVGNVYELKLNLYADKNWVQIDDGEFTYAQLAKSYHAKIPFEKIRNFFLFRKVFDVNYNFDFFGVRYLLPKTQRYEKIKHAYNIDLINMETAYQSLSQKNKEDILMLFGLDFELSSGQNLILMQSLYTDGVVSSIEEEIKLYRYMLEMLDVNESACIFKPHPASRIDYKIYFPAAIVISNDFPSELLSLTGKQFDIVATLFSSGLEAFKDRATKMFFFGSLWIDMPVRLDGYKIINGEVTHIVPDK